MINGRCWASLALAVLLAACQPTPTGSPPHPSTSPSPSVSAVASATLVTISSEHQVLDLGPFGVGNLSCDSEVFAFTTSSGPRQSRNDLIKVANMDGSNIHVVAHAAHGGTLTDAVPVSADWVLYLEYAQAGASSVASFWYLSAANLHSGKVVALASATSPPATSELPTYATSGDRAVWAQMTGDGRQALFAESLHAATAATVALPDSTRPFSPSIAGSTVVFVDDQTSRPTSADEQHGGVLKRIDLGKVAVQALDATVGYAPTTNGNDVIWTKDSPDPLHPGSSVVWTPLISSLTGTGRRQFTEVADYTLLSDSFAAWPNHESRDLFAYRMNTGRLAEIRMAGRDDLRAVLALCGSTLLYVLPPDVDGDRSVIRSINLDTVFAQVR